MGFIFRAALVSACFASSSLVGIVIDGATNDWVASDLTIQDPIGDPPRSGPDFQSVKVTNDAYNLYLLVEFTSPINLRFFDLKLLIDADGDPSTGVSDNGRGMDCSWDFDRNRGTSTLTSRGDIGRGNLIERLAPDAASTVHEIAVSLEALPAASARQPIHIAFIEENSLDRIPDTGVEFSYTVQGPLAVQPLPIETTKSRDSIRIMSWNVLRDAPFKNNNQAAFLRILTAMNPDIVMFQEIYNAPTDYILQYFKDNLQTRRDEQWEIARMHDCITLSRFPIENSWPTDGNIITRHQTADIIGSNLLISNNHLPCCDSGESGRVRESANVLELLEARLADPSPVPQAVLIGGDLNSGGRAPELIQLTTELLPLEMASPRHVYGYDQYTWGSLGSSFGSSRLDFLLFDPSKIFRHKAFILDTDLLPNSALEELGLEAGDTFISDHLVLVLDVKSPHLPAVLQAGPMAADGSTTSAWWGDLNGFYYPDVLHHDLGWLRLFESDSGLWTQHQSGIWFWTEPEAYPWIFAAR